MFYSIHNKEIREISLEQLDFHDICVGYLTLDELKSCYQDLGLSEVAVKDCMTDLPISGPVWMYMMSSVSV